MDGRVGSWSENLRASFWFLPAVMALAMVALAWATFQVDERFEGTGSGVLYNGGYEGARIVLSTISASMITVAATVFSITIVAMTLASSQFGPRMLTNFIRDRGNQAAIGFFGAVFLYALLILRLIPSDNARVPNISVSLAVVFALAAIVVLIYFIHHIAASIQAMNLVQSIAAGLHESIETLFPDPDDLTDASPASEEVPELEGHGKALRAEASGFLQMVDVDHLVSTAREHDLLVKLETRPGRFVVGNTSVGHVWSGDGARVEPGDDVLHELSCAFTAGARRTHHQDVEFPLKQLVEVAVRALSPAINDPFTAAACVNHIGAALCKVASRRFPARRYVDDHGRLRLVLDDPLDFARLVGEAYDQVRQSADTHVVVYLHILESLARVVDCTTSEARWQVLMTQGKLVMERAEQVVPQPEDLEVVQGRYDALLAAVEHERADR